MKKLYHILLIALLIIPVLNTQAYDKSVKIGIVSDGDNQETINFRESIETEVKSLLSSKYKIKFPDSKFLTSYWNIDSIKLNFDRLLNDEDIDIVLGIGPATSVIMANQIPFDKPVIAVGDIKSTCYGFPKTDDNTSGIKNFTYLTVPCSTKKDLEAFHSIYPFKNLAFIIDESFPGSVSVCREIIEEANEVYNTKVITLPLGEDYEETINNMSEDIDAIYFGPMFRLNKNDLENLINVINSKGLPSFSMRGVRDVESGIMASMCGFSNNNKTSRRLALNIEKILEGEKVSKLPVIIKYNEQLTINMRTVRQIDFYPSVATLTEAVLINEEKTEISRTLSFESVIAEALEANLGYKIPQQEVAVGKQDINISRANFLPTLEASASGIQIDKDRAKSSLGMNAEQMVTGNLTLTQVLYSEKALANYKIQKYLQQGREYKSTAAELDVILQSSTAFVTVLLAKTNEKIQKENLSLTRKNLELAKMREGVGYSGISDVHRWESMLATDKIALMYATNDRKSAEIALNQVLNQPLKEEFRTVDITVDSLSKFFSDEIIDICLSNQKIYYMMCDFLVEESKKNLPEYKDMDLSMKAQSRYVSSLKRSYYHPTIAVQAQTDYVFNRSGEGSSFEAPGNIPVLDLSNNQIGYVPMEGMFYEPQDLSWNAGIRISIPIATGGARKAELQKAKIQSIELQTQNALLHERMTQQIRTNFEKISVSQPKIALAKEASLAADENLEITQEYYLKGLVSATELIDAQNAAIKARLFATCAVYEYLIDLMVISRSVGGYYFLSTSEQNAAFRDRFNAFFQEQNLGHIISM